MILIATPRDSCRGIVIDDLLMQNFFMLKNYDVCLTSEQLLWIEIYLLKLIQSQTYSFEKFLLKNPDCSLPKSSNIRKYSPFLNKNLVLRLRWRLEYAAMISDETKNPIHYISHLLVDWYHHRYKHVYHETVVNEIFQKHHTFQFFASYAVPVGILSFNIKLPVIANLLDKMQTIAELELDGYQPNDAETKQSFVFGKL